MAVYDDQNEKTGGVDQLDRDSEIDDLEQSFSAPAIRDSERNVSPKYSSKSKKDNTDKVDASDLNNAEQKAGSPDSNATDKVGAGFTGDVPGIGPVGRAARIKRFFFGTTRRKTTTGIATGGLIAGLAIGGFMGMMPMKLIFFANHIQNAGFGVITGNQEQLAENILSRYIVKQVMPGLTGACTTTNVNKSCAVVAPGNSQVSKLYNAWRDHNLEGKLAKNHGFEIKRINNKFYLNVKGIPGDVDLGDVQRFKNFDGNLFAEIDHPDRQKIRSIARTSLNGETRFKNRVLYYQTARLLERKYGIKRCLVMCSTRDAWNDKTKDLKDKSQIAKIHMMERVFAPQNEAFQLLLECGLGGFDCTEMLDADDDGNRMTKYERDLAARLIAYRNTMGLSKYTELLQDSEDLRKRGLVTRMSEKVFGPLLTKISAKAIPVVGWVDTVVLMAYGLTRAGPALMTLTYSLNAATAVAYYSTVQTTASEQMLGESDPYALGSMTELFDQNPENDQNGAGAESSPLYGIVTGDTPIASTASNPLFMFGATTADQSVRRYQCNNPEDIPNPICPEEAFDERSKSRLTNFVGGVSSWLTFASSSVKLGNIDLLTIMELWKTSSDWLFGKLSVVIDWIVKSIIPESWLQAIADFAEPYIEALTKYFATFVVSMLTTNPSGARLFNIAVAGSLISAREQGIASGGEVLDNKTVLEIQAEQEEFERIAFESKPFFERMFDTTDKRSAVSRFAMSMPTSTGGFQSKLASFFANPLGNNANYLASAFTPRTTAASINAYQAMGIVPVGYAPTDSVFQPDIENYEEANNCSDPDNAKNWADAIPVDAPDWSNESSLNTDAFYSGQLMPTETNGCMLVNSVVSALGSEYDESFLPKDDPIVTDTTDGTTVPTGEWVNPMAGQSYRISSPFGPRSIFGYTFHYGTDLAAPNGVPYTAAAGGEVIFVGQEKWGTNYIHILHKDVNGKDIITEYAHSYRDKIYVNVGDQVESGQVIGLVGDQGNVTGPHLHFGVRDANLSRWSSYIDPAIFMRGQGAPL